MLRPDERTARARGLRRDASLAERRLWKLLRDRGVAGAKFRRQLPIDRFFADFACVEARLVVELDGPGHQMQLEYDAARTEVIEAAGWQVVRFETQTVIDHPAVVSEVIAQAVRLTSGHLASGGGGW
ncbi:MAG TPA: DUF559 domain-containing protein [Caulobacteraceae bacterium]|jgi:very-short-patch-repair endonuclease|nr:DUF559 domain-containing protein [Caulobacteraceae bacterium]